MCGIYSWLWFEYVKPGNLLEILDIYEDNFKIIFHKIILPKVVPIFFRYVEKQQRGFVSKVMSISFYKIWETYFSFDRL